MPAINVEKGGIYPIPDNVPFEEATFTEPLACVLRGQRRAGLKEGQSVLVLGSGISGMIHINLAKAKGASHIMATDISEYRLEMAKNFGADVAINAKEDVPSKVREINNGYLADLVILCTSATPAITQALKSVERGGTVLFFAPADEGVTLPVPINEIFWRRDVTLTTTYAGSPMDHLEALKWISSGNLDLKDMITHKLPLAETSKGFQLVAKSDDSLKVVVDPQR
jgi:L-iditol 2-dehydrogenase